MSDIFFSYAHADRALVQEMAKALKAEGYSLSNDPPSGKPKAKPNPTPNPLNRVLEEIKAARCVIAVWSKSSVKRRFVHAEAEEAMRQDKLISVQIDDCELPDEYHGTGVHDLRGWRGARDDPDWQRVVSGVGVLAGHSRTADVAPPVPPARNRHIVFVLIGVVIMGALAGGYYYLNRDTIRSVLHQGDDGVDGRYIPPWHKKKE